jgi:hypothetical protein
MTRATTARPAKAGRDRLMAAFLLAALVSVVLHFIQPWGRYALYPFALMATWAHEMGHGLAAIALGGSFSHLELYSDLGGVAYHTAGGFFARPLVSMAGLLGPAIAGGAVIVMGARSERAARSVITVLAVAIALSIAIWIRSLFGVLAMGLITLALALLAARGGQMAELFTTQLIGIQFCLGSLGDFDYMFSPGFVRDGRPMLSDTGAIAESWLLPYWFWGALVAALSVAILALAFYRAWIRPYRSA